MYAKATLLYSTHALCAKRVRTGFGTLQSLIANGTGIACLHRTYLKMQRFELKIELENATATEKDCLFHRHHTVNSQVVAEYSNSRFYGNREARIAAHLRALVKRGLRRSGA